MLALSSSASVAEVRELIYLTYPDAGWAEEYGFSLWSARCYLSKHQEEFEQRNLIVIGKNQAIAKDCLLAAFYWPFLGAPIAQLEKLDFPVNAIAGLAIEIERRSSKET